MKSIVQPVMFYHSTAEGPMRATSVYVYYIADTKIEYTK